MSIQDDNATVETYLAKLASDGPMREKIAIIRKLARLDDPQVISTLRELTQSSSVPVARAAILAISDVASCEDLAFLVNLLNDDTHLFVRRAAVQAMGQSGCQAFVPQLVNLLDDETLVSLAREALLALKVDPDFF